MVRVKDFNGHFDFCNNSIKIGTAARIASAPKRETDIRWNKIATSDYS